MYLSVWFYNSLYNEYVILVHAATTQYLKHSFTQSGNVVVEDLW